MIIYVHGALSTRRSFSYITQSLQDIPIPHKFFGYDVRASRADDIVNSLTEFVRKADSQTPVMFISHSYGGVVSVAAARQLTQACTVLSMATPYNGSAEASFLKFLRPSSKLLANIGSFNSFMRGFSAKPLPCRVRGLVTTAGGAEWMSDANDGVVTVESQLHYEHDPNWSGVKVDANHFEVLLMPKVVELIRKEISRFTSLTS